jgi:hypothetical protein
VGEVKAKFSISSILKSSRKILFLENITKKQKEKRTMQGKTIAIYSIS